MNRQQILVVEDEDHLAIGIKFNLEAEGYSVTVAGDGPTALAVLNRPDDKTDLLILDLMLPGMSGYAVCQSIREAGRELPVLMLSARTLSEDRTRGFNAGADQYLMKPFDLDELLSRVKNLLARHTGRKERAPRPADSAVYRFGNAAVNFDTYEVQVNGGAEKLTSLELKLLKYFVEHEGRVISRDELLEEVWELPGNLNTRAVDQFIRRLRKAFEPDSANPRHFLTIRDAGYRFVAGGDEDAS